MIATLRAWALAVLLLAAAIVVFLIVTAPVAELDELRTDEPDVSVATVAPAVIYQEEVVGDG